MGKKITFELGPAAIVLIAVAAVAGYVIGSSYPIGGRNAAVENLASYQTVPQTNQVTPVEAIDQDDIKRWATEIGLDSSQFNSCFDSQEYLQEVGIEYAQGTDVGVVATPTFFVGNERDGFVSMTGAQPFDVFSNLIDSYLNGSAPQAQMRLNIDPVGNSSVIGNRDADVYILEFSDFQCPFCRAFYTETLPLIERDYILGGRVALVYKEFPLESIHPGAVPYALAAKCAQEQGQWRPMHDKIFDEQNKLGVATIPYA